MKKYSIFAELYEEGNLPPQEIIEWVQYLVDTEQEPWYTEYKQLILQSAAVKEALANLVREKLQHYRG